MGITLREWSQQWLEVYVKPVAERAMNTTMTTCTSISPAEIR